MSETFNKIDSDTLEHVITKTVTRRELERQLAKLDNDILTLGDRRKSILGRLKQLGRR